MFLCLLQCTKPVQPLPSRPSTRVSYSAGDQDRHNSSEPITRREVCLRGLSPVGVCVCSAVVKERSSLYDQYFSYVLAHFQSEYDSWIEPYRTSLIDSIATEDSIKILDVGVGTGVNFSFLSARTPNAEVVGLDPNPSMGQYAQQAARDASLKDFQFVTGYGESMPFETNTFDVAIGTLLLCSVPDVQSVLSEIRRVVKPQGRYLFIEHVAAPVGSTTRLLQTLFNPLQQLIADGCHLNRETLTSIESSGFQSVQAQSIYIEKAAFLAPHIIGSAFV